MKFRNNRLIWQRETELKILLSFIKVINIFRINLRGEKYMNIKSKKIMSMMIIAVLVIIGAPHLSQAGLQANKGGSTLTHVKANDLFIEIRKMETQYGTLGKNAILDTTTYIDSIENGIDSHMILNTEYGTIAILAKSKYGQDSSSSNDTTTGNESGVFRLGGYGSGYSTVYENVAGIYTSTKMSIRTL